MNNQKDEKSVYVSGPPVIVVSKPIFYDQVKLTVQTRRSEYRTYATDSELAALLPNEWPAVMKMYVIADHLR